MISERVDNRIVERELISEDPRRLLVAGHSAGNGSASTSNDGVVIGELIGLRGSGGVALVTFPNQIGTAAVAARSVVDLFGDHIGQQVVLTFDGGDRSKPIVMGVLRASAEPADDRSTVVEVERDGQRVVIDAKKQLVLRCGKASITLTREGKVLIQGAYVSSRSTGVNRIKGGSVQLN